MLSGKFCENQENTRARGNYGLKSNVAEFMTGSELDLHLMDFIVLIGQIMSGIDYMDGL